jgi:putative selenate reductase FAD-binding subunit
MLILRNLIRPSTLEEAYVLLQEPCHIALAGATSFHLQEAEGTGVELTHLLDNTIAAKDGLLRIGAMASLRSLETDPLVAKGPLSVLRSSVRHLMGPALRNLATVGGSVGSHLPQSELMTVLLALDARVCLYRGGTISIEEWLSTPNSRDIILEVELNKEQEKAGFFAVRNSYTDTAMLCAAACRQNGFWRIAVGARPDGALLFVFPDNEEPETIAAECSHITPLGENLLASEAYRRGICQEVIRRAIEEACECK